MRAKQGLVLLIFGLAAATGAGVWVMGGGEREEPTVKRTLAGPPPVAQAPTPPPLSARDLADWTPPEKPIIIPEREQEQPEADRSGDRRDRGERARQEMMRQFDTDGDGELSEAEREAARKQWEARAATGRELLLRRFDTDGDGELNEQERETARAEMRRVRDEIAGRIVPEYDLDGDGELNREERQAAAPAFRAEYERIRTVAQLDLDGSGAIDSAELARAILAVTDGDETMDLNRDGTVDYQDAEYAAEVAQDGS